MDFWWKTAQLLYSFVSMFEDLQEKEYIPVDPEVWRQREARRYKVWSWHGEHGNREWHLHGTREAHSSEIWYKKIKWKVGGQIHSYLNSNFIWKQFLVCYSFVNYIMPKEKIWQCWGRIWKQNCCSKCIPQVLHVKSELLSSLYEKRTQTFTWFEIIQKTWSSGWYWTIR